MNPQLILTLQNQNQQLKSKLNQLNQLFTEATTPHHQPLIHTHTVQSQINLQHQLVLSAYKKQVQLLNDSLREADESYQLLNKQYYKQQQMLRECQNQIRRLQDQLQNQSHKITDLKQESEMSNKQILQNYNKKLQEYSQRYEQQHQELTTKIEELQSKLAQKNRMWSQSQTENQKLKQFLNLQIQKRKNRDKQNDDTIYRLENQLASQEKKKIQLHQAINDKVAQNIEKEGIIRQLQKMAREMNIRLVAVEKQADRKVFKERQLTKKAMEGMQMVRKYSDIQLKKSRKKQREYVMNQKQLLSKLKAASKDGLSDTSMRSIKSYRKGSLPIDQTPKLNISKFHRKPLNKLKLTNDQQTNKQTHKYEKSNILDLSHISTQKNRGEQETGKSITQGQKQSPNISNFLLDDSEPQINAAIHVKGEDQNKHKFSGSKSTPKLEIKSLDYTLKTTNKMQSAQTPSFQSARAWNNINSFK